MHMTESSNNELRQYCLNVQHDETLLGTRYFSANLLIDKMGSVPKYFPIFFIHSVTDGDGQGSILIHVFYQIKKLSVLTYLYFQN